MKKFIFSMIAVMGLAMAACSTNGASEQTDSVATDSIEVVDSIAADTVVVADSLSADSI